MARTKRTARKSTGGRRPNYMLGPWTEEGSEDFLEEFGMPTLLWRVLHLVGY